APPRAKFWNSCAITRKLKRCWDGSRSILCRKGYKRLVRISKIICICTRLICLRCDRGKRGGTLCRRLFSPEAREPDYFHSPTSSQNHYGHLEKSPPLIRSWANST